MQLAVVVVVKNVMGIVRGDIIMCKDDIIEGLKKCSVVRDSEMDYRNSCLSCPYGKSGGQTLVCRQLLNDILKYMKEADSSPERIFSIPVEHVCNVMQEYETHEMQREVCKEELAELIQALTKYSRGKVGKTKYTVNEARAMIVEEFTHVAIALGMLKKIYNISQDEIDVEVKRKAEESGFDITKYKVFNLHDEGEDCYISPGREYYLTIIPAGEKCFPGQKIIRLSRIVDTSNFDKMIFTNYHQLLTSIFGFRDYKIDSFSRSTGVGTDIISFVSNGTEYKFSSLNPSIFPIYSCVSIKKEDS